MGHTNPRGGYLRDLCHICICILLLLSLYLFPHMITNPIITTEGPRSHGQYIIFKAGLMWLCPPENCESASEQGSEARCQRSTASEAKIVAGHRVCLLKPKWDYKYNFSHTWSDQHKYFGSLWAQHKKIPPTYGLFPPPCSRRNLILKLVEG